MFDKFFSVANDSPMDKKAALEVEKKRLVRWQESEELCWKWTNYLQKKSNKIRDCC
jgi:hypothetical protein